MYIRPICDIEDGRHKPSARLAWLDFGSLSQPSQFPQARHDTTAQRRTDKRRLHYLASGEGKVGRLYVPTPFWDVPPFAPVPRALDPNRLSRETMGPAAFTAETRERQGCVLFALGLNPSIPGSIPRFLIHSRGIQVHLFPLKKVQVAGSPRKSTAEQVWWKRCLIP